MARFGWSMHLMHTVLRQQSALGLLPVIIVHLVVHKQAQVILTFCCQMSALKSRITSVMYRQ